MPKKKLDDFEKITVLCRSLTAINSKIKKINMIRPLSDSDVKKRESLPKLEEAKEEIKKEIQELKNEFLNYLDQMPIDGEYAFCIDIYRQILRLHYIDEKSWTDAIKNVGLNMEPANFRRDICIRLIVLDYTVK